MILKESVWLLLILSVFGSIESSLSEESSPWAHTDPADIRLISAATATGTSKQIPLGLQFRIAKGWKIYWRTPGDSGYPPSLKIRRSQNLSELTWQWPLPLRFTFFGSENYGYKDDIVFPLAATLKDNQRILNIDATVEALACKEICVPLEVPLSLNLPSGPAKPTRYTQLIDRYRARVPNSFSNIDFKIKKIRLIDTKGSLALSLAVTSSIPMTTPDAYIESSRGFIFSKPKIDISSDRQAASFEYAIFGAENYSFKTIPITITIVDGDRFVEKRTIARFGKIESANPARLWMTMIALAMLGGLILNFMPCVLPVLALKLISAIHHKDQSHKDIAFGFLASAAGILSAFVVLASLLIVLKLSGQALGWGIQFQNPIFLTAMLFLVTVFSANLFGWLDVPLPHAFSNVYRPKLDFEQNSPNRRRLLESFVSGALVTLLATPCSAPFVGTAVGFALPRGPFEILSIFLFMGLGLASPFLLVALNPRLVSFLPKSGPWIKKLRVILGLLLLATALWLLSIIQPQLEFLWFCLISVGVILTFSLLGLAHLVEIRGIKKLAAILTAIVLVLTAVAKPNPKSNFEGETKITVKGAESFWIDFKPRKLSALIADGKTVLVDITADWCLTCKLNKNLVLNQGKVNELIRNGTVVAMRGDWTTPDDAIATYLGSFQRYGIPFNIIYGPQSSEGIILPELLTDTSVLEALKAVDSKLKL